EATDSRADAPEPEARVRAHAVVPAGARCHRAAARARSVGDYRAARPRPARVSPERLPGRAAGPAGLPAAVVEDRARRGGARRAGAHLGARQDAASSRRVAELGTLTRACPYGQSASSGQTPQCGSASVQVAPP